jgi:chemotaxis methyl-accepting protein methylase
MTAHDPLLPPHKASFHHVVFADDVADRGRALNFAGGQPAAEPPARASESLAPDERAFVIWLFEQAGICARNYRQETLVRRLPACLRLIRVASVREARRALELNPALVPDAVDTLVIGVTSFFRDAQVFDALRDRVLPLLLEARRPLRIWSVGCSDGQEMYSIIMLLAELGWLNRADLLGTDCRVPAVRRAAAGAFSDADVRSVPSTMLRRYFTLSEWGWRVEARLRTVVQWRAGDVLQVDEPGIWDLILCRNVAMYFEPHVASDLWQRLHAALGRGRILVTGKAERPGEGFTSLAPCIYRS